MLMPRPHMQAFFPGALRLTDFNTVTPLGWADATGGVGDRLKSFLKRKS
jgi:hypothetical protein